MIRDTAHFRSMIDVFRRSALGEVCWTTAMSGISEATHATSANLIGAHDGQLQFSWANNLDPCVWEDLGESLTNVDTNPRLRVGSGARPFVRVEGLDFGSDELTRRFPVYGEVCRKYDLGFGSQMNLEMNESDFVGLALLRGRRQGHGDPEDAAALSALTPYLLDAVKLRRAIEDQGALITCGAMEQMSAAAFLCNSWGRVIRMTSAAESMVGRSGPFVLRNGILSCHSPAASGRLTDAILAAAGDALSPMRSVVLVGRTGERIVADIGPLPTPAGALDFAPRAIVTLRRKSPAPPVDLVAAALDLTAAEAAVARYLACGFSRAEIAERRGASIETVKAQLKSIFAKLGISREVELVVRVLEIA